MEISKRELESQYNLSRDVYNGLEAKNVETRTVEFNQSGGGLYVSNEELDTIFSEIEASLYKLNDPYTIILLCFYVPVFLLAFLGNMVVLIIVIPNRGAWGVTSNFLVNLAVADLLVAVVCIPMTVAQQVYQPWLYGEVLCKGSGYLQGVSVTASIFTITAMSLDRCLAIKHPMRFRRIRTASYVRRFLLIIWFGSALIFTPLLFIRITESHEVLPDRFLTYCVEKWPNIRSRRSFDVCLLVILYLIPGIIVIVCYAVMGRRLWTPDKELDQRSKELKLDGGFRRRHSVMRDRRTLAKMLIVMATLFAACWMPYYIVSTYVSFSDRRTTDGLLKVLSFALLLGHINSVSNPILYCFMNISFRRYCTAMLRCRSHHQRLPSYRQSPGSLTTARANENGRTYRSSIASSIRTKSLHGERLGLSNAEMVTINCETDYYGALHLSPLEPVCRAHRVSFSEVDGVRCRATVETLDKITSRQNDNGVIIPKRNTIVSFEPSL